MNRSLLTATLIPNSTNVQQHKEEIFSPGVEWFVKSLMVTISLLGIIGNGFMCYFFAKKRIRRTSFNMLLLNLSIADLLVDVFAYPLYFVDLKALRGYPTVTANVLCSFPPSTSGVAFAVSILTLTYISINRFVYVRYPLKTAWFKSRKTTCCTLLMIWAVSIGYIMPYALAFQFDAKIAFCKREWPKDINVNLWMATILVAGLIVPLFVMLITFVSTLRRLKTMTIEQRETMKKKKRAVRLLGFLTLAFAICSGPTLICLPLSVRFKSFWGTGVKGEYQKLRVMPILFLLNLANTVADPVLYGYLNHEFQKCFKEVLADIKSGFGIRGRPEENDTATLEFNEQQPNLNIQ